MHLASLTAKASFLASRQAGWRERLRPTLERLRTSQLRSGSLYTNLRAFIPVAALALIWAWVNHRSLVSDLHQVSTRSVTVRHLIFAAGVATLWNLWLSLSVYTREAPLKDLLAELRRLFFSSVACGCFLLLGVFTRHLYGWGVQLGWFTTLALIVLSWGLLGSFLLVSLLSKRMFRKRAALLVGSGRLAFILRERLKSQYSPYTIYGCVDEVYRGVDPERDRYLGSIEGLGELLKSHPIEVVLIGLPIKSKYDMIQQTIDICRTVGVETHYMLDFFETAESRLSSHPQKEQNLGVVSREAWSPMQHLKLLFDFVGAFFLIVLFSPMMIATALAVRFTSPGPVFFVQQRYGRNRKRFPMFKFRSMVVDAEAKQAALESKNEAQGPVFKLKADPRVTRVGAFIRKTSMDELPQLFNVLRGEMSLVGPRPLPLRDVSRFEEVWLLRRFSVRPGLTCLWQISGRSNTGFDDWIKQDLTYIDNWSFYLDLKILVLTIPAVLRSRGAV